MWSPPSHPADDVADLLEQLVARDETLATAESLTGGLLAARVTDVVRTQLLALDGDRRAIREATCAAAVSLLRDLLREEPGLR